MERLIILSGIVGALFAFLSLVQGMESMTVVRLFGLAWTSTFIFLLLALAFAEAKSDD